MILERANTEVLDKRTFHILGLAYGYRWHHVADDNEGSKGVANPAAYFRNAEEFSSVVLPKRKGRSSCMQVLQHFSPV